MTNYFELEFHPNLDSRYANVSVTWTDDQSYLYLRLYLP